MRARRWRAARCSSLVYLSVLFAVLVTDAR
jgi:hypothetical protein